MKNTDQKLTRQDLWKIFRGQIFIRSALNFERQQCMGFTTAMRPIINKYYETPEERAQAIDRHMQLFLTQPMVSAIPVGVAAAMEERIATEGDLDPSSVNEVKIALMGPLAALGQRALHVHHGEIVGAEQVGDVAQEVGGVALLGLPAAVEGPLVLVVDVGTERAVAGEGDGQRHGLGRRLVPAGRLSAVRGSRSCRRVSWRRSRRRRSFDGRVPTLGGTGTASEQEPNSRKFDNNNNNEKDLQRSRTGRFRVHVMPFLEPLEH